MKVNSLLCNTVAASAESDRQLTCTIVYYYSSLEERFDLHSMSFDDCFQLASSDEK